MNKYKEDFPLYKNNPDLAYLDNAASSLKCQHVIDKLDYYYNKLGVNVHRGVYELSYQATDLYEEARNKISRFINASFEEVIFTRGTTSSLNMVALTYGEQNIKEDDEIIVSVLEHHSNLIPWIKLCQKKKAKLVYVPLENNRITIQNFKKVLSDKTKIVALNHVSNVMGYKSPIEEIIKLAHEKKAIVVVDGAQAVPHMKVDMKKLDADFYAFSGHKMTGPTGIGVLYGKKHLLDKIEPLEYGGDMADEVSLFEATYKDTPYKFEAGTPIIAEAIGLGEACDYLDSIGFDYISKKEYELKEYALKKLQEIEGIEIYNPDCETGIITFNVLGIHPHDVASILDKNGVCVRAGHHCAQPITHHLNQISTLRASFYFYNDEEDADKLVFSVKEAVEFFGKF